MKQRRIPGTRAKPKTNASDNLELLEQWINSHPEPERERLLSMPLDEVVAELEAHLAADSPSEPPGKL